jgi:hypothetical protein
MVLTNKGKKVEFIVESNIQRTEKLKPDSKRFKSYLRQLLYYLVISGNDTRILVFGVQITKEWFG